MNDDDAPHNRWGDMYLVPVSPCFNCRHATYGQPRCSAFPDFIPWPILKGERDHRTPYPGDNGIRYERSPYRTTDGPVMAAHLYSYTGRRVTTLWMGEDGSCGCRTREDGELGGASDSTRHCRWERPRQPSSPTGRNPCRTLPILHGTNRWMPSMPNCARLTARIPTKHPCRATSWCAIRLLSAYPASPCDTPVAVANNGV